MLSGSSGGDERKPGGWIKGAKLLFERVKTGENKEQQRARRYGEMRRQKTQERHVLEGGARSQTRPGQKTPEQIEYERAERRVESERRRQEGAPRVAYPPPSAMAAMAGESLPLAAADPNQFQYAPSSRQPTRAEILRMSEQIKQRQVRDANPPMDDSPPEMAFM